MRNMRNQTTETLPTLQAGREGQASLSALSFLKMDEICVAFVCVLICMVNLNCEIATPEAAYQGNGRAAEADD